jgi:hypothetical protein
MDNSIVVTALDARALKVRRLGAEFRLLLPCRQVRVRTEGPCQKQKEISRLRDAPPVHRPLPVTGTGH